jgi:hypothetical protein
MTLICIALEMSGRGKNARGSFEKDHTEVTMLVAFPRAAGASQDAPVVPLTLHEASVSASAVAVMSAVMVRTDPLSSMP